MIWPCDWLRQRGVVRQMKAAIRDLRQMADYQNKLANFFEEKLMGQRAQDDATVQAELKRLQDENAAQKAQITTLTAQAGDAEDLTADSAMHATAEAIRAAQATPAPLT